MGHVQTMKLILTVFRLEIKIQSLQIIKIKIVTFVGNDLSLLI